MGKNKQQRPKRKKVKSSNQDKQKMKDVLLKLAENKAKNKNIVQKNSSISQMHIKHKKIHKTALPGKEEHVQQEEEAVPQVESAKPMVNIFAVDSYQAQKPVIVASSGAQKMEQENLESKARRIMGENFNIDKFGQKPLRIIEQNNEPIVMSDDEDQPNSASTITHQNLKVPQGSKSIKRKKQIEQLREKLPIYMKEQEIVETVNGHLVTLICGETGSGKSTQLPQFLVEKNYQKLGKIGVTQPRRLATTSLARRVAQQMNYKIGAEVAYQVRHERQQSTQSFIKFMTDGILLKEMSSDPLLLEYGVIIIDEAHERKLNTDILIGLMSRLILIRYKMSLEDKCSPLRLVIMSATLRVTDFQNKNLFNFHVPILKIEAKMFPVTIFHERNTPENYIDCAVKKCIKIHQQLPPGDVLVFLTGKQQIHEMAIKLQVELGRFDVEQRQMQDQNNEEIKAEGEYFEEQPVRKNSTSHITDFMIFKLYSSLPTDQQDKVFKAMKPGCRKFIVSTNIAETSITVPNIRYVIDSGQQKHRYFEDVWKWRKGWGSKAMATQRAGRAGRTTHGYCYRLYSSALYANIMEEHPEPEICRLPLESVILEIKAIGYKNSFEFPFPTPPPTENIKRSLENLIEIKALQGQIDTIYRKKPQNAQESEQKEAEITTVVIDNSKITELGKIISFIPLSPRLSKMLLVGSKLGVQKFIILIAILLTVETIFRTKFKQIDMDDEKNGKGKRIEQKKQEESGFLKKYSKYIRKDCESDLFVSMNVSGEFLQRIHDGRVGKSRQNEKSIHDSIIAQCQNLELNTNTMRQFYYNCDQICQIYETLTGSKIDLSHYQQPSPQQTRTILDILLSTYHGNVCRIEQNNKYRNKDQELVYLHRMSLLYKQRNLFVGCIDFYQSEINNRKYMRYPFKVVDYELLATFGSVRETAEYQWDGKQVVGKAAGHIFGWEIPNLVMKELKGEGKYYAFARMLLAGDVVSSWRVLSEKNWLNYQIVNIRPDNLQEKVQRLVTQFRKYDIYSKQKLIQQTKNSPHFLEKELKLWLNVKNYDAVYKTLRNSLISSST